MSSGPESQSVQSNRRSFLAGLLAAGSAAVGALLAFPLVRFTLHPVLARTTEKSWSDVGSVDEFQNIDAPIKKLVTKVENGVLKTQYQFFRQLTRNKEELA